MKNKLIQETGQPKLGWLKEPVSLVNYLDFDYRSVMDRPYPNWRKRLKFNQFQFIGLMNAEVICGLAIVDLKVVSNAFFYLYDIRQGTLHERSYLQPMGIGTHMGTEPDRGQARFKNSKCSMVFDVCAETGARNVSVSTSDGVRIQATVAQKAQFEPLRVCSRAGYNGWVFTQKAAGLEVTGEVNWQGEAFRLEQSGTKGSYDWSAGYMRRETSWNWACMAGTSEQGEVLGLNLASGVNETGVTENCLWINDKLIKLDLAEFTFDRQQIENTWRIRTSDGKVELNFVPQGRRQEKLDVVLLASNFKQLFGHFNGRVKSGRKWIDVTNVPGFVEDHFARW